MHFAASRARAPEQLSGPGGCNDDNQCRCHNRSYKDMIDLAVPVQQLIVAFGLQVSHRSLLIRSFLYENDFSCRCKLD